ncbi:MAG: hypothetical protein RLZZ628_3211, partial [Bacteroidota bacterium]
MIANLRQAYNAAFTPEKYAAFLEAVYAAYHHRP